jgi:hypothetical protein
LALLGRGQTEEQKAAKAADKAQQKDLADRQKALKVDQERIQKELTARDQQRTSFSTSPAGRARAAFAQGDRLFQFVIDVKETQAVVIPMGPAKTATTTSDPVAILNSVCDEGWDLVNGSFVFHELGSESRDKFLASGQHVAVRGTVIGYYLFRRDEANRRTARDPWDVPARERACPHCGETMNAVATVCPSCLSTSDPWQFAHERWFRRVGEDWHFLDEATGEWRKQAMGDDEAAASSG